MWLASHSHVFMHVMRTSLFVHELFCAVIVSIFLSGRCVRKSRGSQHILCSAQMCVQLHTCMNTIHTCMHAHVYTPMYVHTVRMYMCATTCMYMYICIYMYIPVHACMHVHVGTCMHPHCGLSIPTRAQSYAHTPHKQYHTQTTSCSTGTLHH